MVWTKRPPHFIASAQTRSTPEECLAQATMLLAFCAEGFAIHVIDADLQRDSEGEALT